MSRYGLDYYGVGYYGPDPYVTFDASPFTAKPYGHGNILLRWNNPTGKYSKIKIVRNSYGFAVNAFDGDALKLDGTNAFVFKGQAPVSFLDTVSSTKGGFYYYSIFVYQTTAAPFSWTRVANTIGVSVKDYGNTETLYNYLPEVYRLRQPYVATSDTWDNPDLLAFLSVFGFQLDQTQTVTDLLTRRYNFQTVNGTLIPSMLAQFGIDYEPELGLQQGRTLLRDAVPLLQKKGSRLGLIEYVKGYTSYGVPIPVGTEPLPSVKGIQIGHNLMLNYNDSSFEESLGNWASADGSAVFSRPDISPVKSMSLTSNVATLTIGAHGLKAYNTVYIKNTPFPILTPAATTPVTITAVTSTTISFALTGTNLVDTSGFNLVTNDYGTVVPAPTPYAESTLPTLYPNKQNGIMGVTCSNGVGGTLTFECGSTSPIKKGIPVTAGLSYTFSAYTAKGSTARSIVAKINWYTRFGVIISTSSGTGVTNTGAVFSDTYRPYVTATAPTGAVYAVPAISIAAAAGNSANEWHYFDTLQFEQAAAKTDFDEARNVHLTLRATRINELKNPSFASPIAPWRIALGTATTSVDTVIPEPNADLFAVYKTDIGVTLAGKATITTLYPHIFKVGDVVNVINVAGTGITGSNFNGARTITDTSEYAFSYTLAGTQASLTTTAGQAYLQGNVLKVTSSAAISITISSATTTADLMPIYYPGSDYTFSFYAQTASASETVIPRILWYQSDQVTPIGSATTGLSYSVGSTGWTRAFVTGAAPANAAYAAVEFVWNTVASGDVLEVDKALFENSSFVLDYFDGSIGPENSNSLRWEGDVVNGARSHFYKNKYAVQKRLAAGALNEYITLGSTIAVYMDQPGT
jgi:hypothetical protein